MWKTAFKKLKEYGLLKQTLSLQGFQRLSSTNFIWSTFEYFVPYVKSLSHNLVRYGFQHSKPCFHPNFSKAFSKPSFQMLFLTPDDFGDIRQNNSQTFSYKTAIYIRTKNALHNNPVMPCSVLPSIQISILLF